MNIKIALLRGINVGKHNRLRMADLKVALSKIGLQNVVTYIQSGNLIFASGKDNSVLEQEIATCISNEFGFQVPVIVKSKADLERNINDNPYYKEDNSKLHFTFLKSGPNRTNLKTINYTAFLPDKFKISTDVIYLCLENKYHKTKPSNAYFEKQLQTQTTTRNWKTTYKLLELCNNYNSQKKAS